MIIKYLSLNKEKVKCAELFVIGGLLYELISSREIIDSKKGRRQHAVMNGAAGTGNPFCIYTRPLHSLQKSLRDYLFNLYPCLEPIQPTIYSYQQWYNCRELRLLSSMLSYPCLIYMMLSPSNFRLMITSSH